MKKALIVGLVLAFTAGLCLAAGQTMSIVNQETIRKGPAPAEKSQPRLPGIFQAGKALLNEGFEGATFPPEGWAMYDLDGYTARQWLRATTYPRTGVAYAYHQYYGSLDQNGWLVTPRLSVAAGDSFIFWQRDIYSFGSWYDYHGVKVTTNADPNPATATYTEIWSGDCGTTYERRALDLSAYAGQSVYIAFHYTGLDADDWLIDDVTGPNLWTPDYEHNISMESINAPIGKIDPGTPVAPSVTILNNGQNTENNFWVYFNIDDGSKAVIYSESYQVTAALDPDSALTIAFPDYTPTTGSYTTTAWVELAGDVNPDDDTLNGSFTSSFMGWTALSSTAPVAVQWPGGCTDGVNLWSVGGLIAGSAVTNAVQVYDPVADSWSQPTTLPVALFRPNCAIIDGKLYAIGGMDAGFAAQAYTQIYDIAGNSWTTGTPPPSARGGCGGGVIDGKMYIVGGAVSGSFPTDCPTWEYNPAADTAGGTPWTQLADCPRGAGGMILGAPFWGAPGLDFIVAGGDYRGYDDYHMFNPSGGWATLATGPTDAGGKDPGLVWDNEHIYLFGGDPNGGWGGYSDKTYHYDLGAGAWVDLDIPLNQAYEGMIGAIIDQKIYSFSGTIGSGPIDPTPFEWTYDLTYGASVPPEIVWTSPADGAVQVHVKEPIVLAFSKPMDTGTIDGYTNPDAGTMDFSWNTTNDTLTLTPQGYYDYSTAYSLIVTAGTDTDGVSLEGLPLTAVSFTTWMAPDIIQSQMDAPGATYVSQIFEPGFAAYTSYLADDINLAGMDSVKVTAVELVGGAWNGHTWHPMDSLYLSFTADSTDLPAWSQEIWGGNLVPGTFDGVFDGVNNTYIMYLDPPVMLGNGKSWMAFAPYMNFAAKDGQCGWAVNDPAVVYGSGPAFRNPGGGFSVGTDWQRASTNLGMLGDGVWRALGYAYPTGVAGGPTAATKAVFALMPNFPNPVSGRTTFSFSLPKASDYSLKVYNIAGQMVQSFSGKGQAGANSVGWNAAKAGAGVYFFQLNAGGQSATRKLVVVK